MPETSIVIRTLNEAKHLGNLLDAVKEQDYKDYEIIIVDSGSSDGTLKIAKEYNARVIEIQPHDFTFGYSLNVGCEAAKGKYLVFASAHVLPTDSNWLSNLVIPFQNKKIAMVYGRQMGDEHSKFSERMDLRRLFKDSPVNSKVPLFYANNANAAVRKDLWEKRKFDEYLFGLEDIDWARAYTEKGYVIHYEPKAVVYHIHEEHWAQVFNRYRREAIAAVRIGLDKAPQADANIVLAALHLFMDLVYTFPNYSFDRLEEILRFRYYQWKGCRTGWRQGKGVDFEREKSEIFQPLENKAVVIQDKRKVKLEEVPVPEMRPGDILIRVDYVGVCRTDIEVFEGTLGYYRDGHAKYPIVPGHEFSGTIMRIGPNNKFQERYKVGQRVVGECILKRGELAERKEVGVINHNGAYGNYIMMPGNAIRRVPENVDAKTAVLTEPLAVVLRALRRIESRLKKGAKIAVIGAGQIGNLCTQVLSRDGYEVTLFDSNEERLKLVQEKAEHTEKIIHDLERFDVVIEATGSKSALEKVLKQSRVDGTILLLGFPYGDIAYNFEDFVGKEQVIIGSVGAEGVDFEHALEILPHLDMKAFTEVVMPLEEFRDAWNTHRTFEHLKILLQP